MFLNPSPDLRFDGVSFNHELILDDCQDFLARGYNFDYSHDFDMTVDIKDWVLPKDTGYFWQVIPLIFKGEPFPGIPWNLTAYTINTLGVKPLLATFSILRGPSEIDPHIDADDELVYNSRHIPVKKRETSVVKYHLTLDTPDDGECGLVVGDETRILKPGDLNCFDETTTHYAYNRGSTPRSALIVSYLRNQL